VRLSGLTTSPLLNGAEGRVLEPLGQDGRYAIKLLSPPAAIEAFPQGCRLKPSNMELVQQQQKQQQPKAEQNASSVTVTAPALWSPDSPEAKLIAAAVEDLAKSLDRECYPDKSVSSAMRAGGLSLCPEALRVLCHMQSTVLFEKMTSGSSLIVARACPQGQSETGLPLLLACSGGVPVWHLQG
jgi:hypothetical protein